MGWLHAFICLLLLGADELVVCVLVFAVVLWYTVLLVFSRLFSHPSEPQEVVSYTNNTRFVHEVGVIFVYKVNV